MSAIMLEPRPEMRMPTRFFMPHRRRSGRADPPPPCGEGLGVGGATTADVLQSPPPYPSPTRGEGRDSQHQSRCELQLAGIARRLGLALAFGLRFDAAAGLDLADPDCGLAGGEQRGEDRVCLG